MTRTARIVLAGLLLPLPFPAALRADADPNPPPLASLDAAATRRCAEAELLRKYPGTQAADYRLQYLYFRVEPGKPVNESALVAVFLAARPRETREETVGKMVRRVHVREQFTVELDERGRARRVTVKPVEQAELVERK